MELKAYNSYCQKHADICYWRSVDGYEVDFIINSKIAIEVKSSKKIGSDHLKGLKAIKEEKSIERCIIVSEDTTEKLKDSIEHYCWRTFLNHLWSHKIF